MDKNRIEAFSDGVIAIIITIMVLELKIPELGKNFNEQEVWKALLSLLPKVMAYLLSFIVIAIMWLNHHLLFEKIPYSDSKLFWYNAFLLFSMSLLPLPTAFLAEYPFLSQSSMFYGLILFMNTTAFYLMIRYVEIEAQMIPYNRKIQKSNLISVILSMVSIPLSLVSTYFSILIFVGIPVWYFLPDRFHK